MQVSPPKMSIESTISWVQPWVMMVRADGAGDGVVEDLGVDRPAFF